MSGQAKTPVIVLTPVKNEEWILERFLQITSEVADAIIVADQQSTDSSRDICKRFPKVHLIENPDPEYNERSRQKLLIEAARQRFPGSKILLALDADEILSADSLGSGDWETIRSVQPGTTLLFQKPDIIFRPERCRPGGGVPLGYVDDGRHHDGLIFHSARIPAGPGIPEYTVRGIRFLHLGMLRETEFFARQKFYSVLENIRHTKSLYQRLIYYSRAITRAQLNAEAVPTPDAWISGWESRGIDLFSYKSQNDNYFTRQVLALFAEHGESKFYWDDIWDFDWEALRQELSVVTHGLQIPARPIKGPGRLRRLILSAIVNAVLRLKMTTTRQ